MASMATVSLSVSRSHWGLETADLPMGGARLLTIEWE